MQASPAIGFIRDRGLRLDECPSPSVSATAIPADGLWCTDAATRRLPRSKASGFKDHKIPTGRREQKLQLLFCWRGVGRSLILAYSLNAEGDCFED